VQHWSGQQSKKQRQRQKEFGVEGAGPPDDAVHRVVLLEQELGQIGAILGERR